MLDYGTITKSIVAAELSEKQKEYREYFEGIMSKWKIESPADLSVADKKKFFEEVDKGWEADEESDAKKSSDRIAQEDLIDEKMVLVKGAIGAFVDYLFDIDGSYDVLKAVAKRNPVVVSEEATMEDIFAMEDVINSTIFVVVKRSLAGVPWNRVNVIKAIKAFTYILTGDPGQGIGELRLLINKPKISEYDQGLRDDLASALKLRVVKGLRAL